MNRLAPGTALLRGEQLRSRNGWLALAVEDDGNVVLRRRQTGRALWSTRTMGQAVTELRMRDDGDLAACLVGGEAAWSSGTAGRPGAELVVRDDGDLVVVAGQVPAWTSRTVQDFDSPTIATTDRFGYSYGETSESWKALCSGLPCFAALEWPGYVTRVVPVTVSGEAVVVQLWKGWCQKFLSLEAYPGGIGAEVGVYRRMPGREAPTSIDFLSDHDERFVLDDLLRLAEDDLWWPCPELGTRLSFRLVNPRTGDTLVSAGSEETYWLAKWMNEVSYLRYSMGHGFRVPLDPTGYQLEYTIDGVTRRW